MAYGSDDEKVVVGTAVPGPEILIHLNRSGFVSSPC